MKTKYSHISEWERKRIEELTQAGSSNKEIAWKLGRAVSTIGRELKRNYVPGAWWYNGEQAQKLAEEWRKHSKEPKISEKTWEKVFELFNLELSPEQIASVVKIGHESIYRRIYAEIRVGGWIENTCVGNAKNGIVGCQNGRLEI